MRPSYNSLCSVSNVFFFRETWQTFLQCFSHHQLVNGFDCWHLLSTLHASANPILRCEANAYFIGPGYAGRLSFFFFLGLPPSFLASRVFAAQRSRARALPLLNLKKKRDCSQSIICRAKKSHPQRFREENSCPDLITHTPPQKSNDRPLTCQVKSLFNIMFNFWIHKVIHTSTWGRWSAFGFSLHYNVLNSLRISVDRYTSIRSTRSWYKFCELYVSLR